MHVIDSWMYHLESYKIIDYCLFSMILIIFLILKSTFKWESTRLFMLFKILKLPLLPWSTIKSATLVKKNSSYKIFQNFNLLPIYLPISIRSKVKVCPVFFFLLSKCVHSDKMSSDIFIDLPVIWEPGIYCDDEANIL